MADQLVDNSGLITGECPITIDDECPPGCEATPEFPQRFPESVNCTLISSTSKRLFPYSAEYLLQLGPEVYFLSVLDTHANLIITHDARTYGLSLDNVPSWWHTAIVENGVIKTFIQAAYPGDMNYIVHINALTGELLFSKNVSATATLPTGIYHSVYGPIINGVTVESTNAGNINDSRAIFRFIDMDTGDYTVQFLVEGSRDNTYLSSTRYINSDNSYNVGYITIKDYDLLTINTCSPSSGVASYTRGIYRLTDDRFIVLWKNAVPELYDGDGNSLKVLDGPFAGIYGNHNDYAVGVAKIILFGDRFIVTFPDVSYRGFSAAGVSEVYNVDDGSFNETVTVPIGGLLSNTEMEVLILTEDTIIADGLNTMRVCDAVFY